MPRGVRSAYLIAGGANTFPPHVLRLIRQAGWTDGELARRAGIDHWELGRILRNGRTPTSEELTAIIRTLTEYLAADPRELLRLAGQDISGNPNAGQQDSQAPAVSMPPRDLPANAEWRWWFERAQRYVVNVDMDKARRAFEVAFKKTKALTISERAAAQATVLTGLSATWYATNDISKAWGLTTEALQKLGMQHMLPERALRFTEAELKHHIDPRVDETAFLAYAEIARLRGQILFTQDRLQSSMRVSKTLEDLGHLYDNNTLLAEAFHLRSGIYWESGTLAAAGDLGWRKIGKRQMIEAALHAAQTSLQHRAIDDLIGQAFSFRDEAKTLHLLGRHKEANRADTLSNDHFGRNPAKANYLIHLGRWLVATEKLVAAENVLRETAYLAHEINSPILLAHSLRWLAELAAFNLDHDLAGIFALASFIVHPDEQAVRDLPLTLTLCRNLFDFPKATKLRGQLDDRVFPFDLVSQMPTSSEQHIQVRLMLLEAAPVIAVRLAS